jgi:thymidylate synthase (FAD)
MNVDLISYTCQASVICAAAALSCNSELPASRVPLNNDKVPKILKRVIESGHHSVLEHAVYTFSVSGVSRVLTHQLVRHRMASYSQQSQRCINSKTPTFITPPSIDGPVKDTSQNLAEDTFNYIMGECWRSYDLLIKCGIPEEDARFVLPGACTTNIVITMNARELLHFFELRMCNRAQWEIRDLANEMYKLCYAADPDIFKYAGPRCWTSECLETVPCGRPPKKTKPR